MSTATKTQRALLTSQSLAAATSVNATELNLSTAYGAKVNVLLTNGASPPTTAPVVKFYTGDATGKKYLEAQFAGDTVANSVNNVPFTFGKDVMFANITITNGATNAITVEAYGQETTTI